MTLTPRFSHDQAAFNRSRFRWLTLLSLAGSVASCNIWSLAQAPPANGMRPIDLRTHAIVNAAVVTAPGQKLDRAVIIVRDGVIEAVGPDVPVPPDARVWQADGMTVYPGLIDPAVLISASDPPASAGSHWNPRVHPELSMADQPAPDASLRKDLRSMGFAAAAFYPSNGAFRGSGVVLALADETPHVLAYKPRAAMAAAFDYGGASGGGGGRGAPREASAYPGSLMGAFALLRQTLADAQWHADCLKVWTQHPQGNEVPKRNDSLVALADVLARRQTVLFDAPDELNALRAARLAREFNLSHTRLGSGYEFRRLKEVVDAMGNSPIILPLEFPKRPDVSSLSAADTVSLRELMTWEQAPTNPRRLVQAGATVALTTHRLKNRSDFPANLRSAIKHGLTEEQALASLTTAPAAILGLDRILGTIEPGKAANLVVVKGSLFDKDSKIHDTWINGRRYEIFKDPTVQLKGKGVITFNTPAAQPPIPQAELDFSIDTTKSTLELTLPDRKKLSAKKVVVQQDQVSFVLDGRPFDVEGYVRLSGLIESNTLSGSGTLPNGDPITFTAIITTPQGDDDDDKPESPQEPGQPPAEQAPGEPNQKADDVTGEWTLRVPELPPDTAVTLTLKLEEDYALSGSINVMGQSADLEGGTFDPETRKLSFTFTSPQGGPASIEATIDGPSITGRVTSNQVTGEFTGSRQGAQSRDRKGAKDKEPPFIPPPEELVLPLGEYGLAIPPVARNVLVQNATIWTCGPQGIVPQGTLFVRDHKIVFVGSNSEWENFSRIARIPQDFTTIDAAGKHITPGLIDCHSHTGISGGVNEWAQANTAECRIADCIDPDDIDWYRELAGGLTAANQLHGSANPIGGQNSVVKLKWGAPRGAEDFSITDAIPGIKFALGENVKRSTGRYPNTRMGVETFIRDAFTAARDYRNQWERYNQLSSAKRLQTMPPRRDLELETLVEILANKRLVHCHSYRQDEILMLIRVADIFGFTIGTFQHVLEGYKVADAIAKHGAGGSSFSDWWAYKIEVMDAIPYNGALMHKVGVLVSFNSDSDELARRMNTEAAKAVRYGGLEPHEALKFVTINPAKQLRIDHRTGSLEKGKDADFVLWSGDPLSTYTRCEQTWIEGAPYFDLETDRRLRDDIDQQRQRIINKILVQAHGEASKGGAETRPDKESASPPQSRPEYAGLHIAEHHLLWLEEQVRLGRDPHEIRPGECGCNDSWAHSHSHE